MSTPGEAGEPEVPEVEYMVQVPWGGEFAARHRVSSGHQTASGLPRAAMRRDDAVRPHIIARSWHIRALW